MILLLLQFAAFPTLSIRSLYPFCAFLRSAGALAKESFLLCVCICVLWLVYAQAIPPKEDNVLLKLWASFSSSA
uniref:Uncharacterized protein n=1 Tax=Anopheles braziliensis TaxID=58242 RepID=A0A2M3ZLG8_9DIPT